jgi:Protein of unknown function with HXXEE motif
MALAFSLLEVEQWNLLGYLQVYFPGAPPVSSSHMRATQGAGVLVAWLWTLAALRARSAQRAAFVVLPLAAIMLMEPLLHVYFAVRFGAYMPGLVMSLIALAPASLALVRRAWRDRLVSRSYILSLALIVLLDFAWWASRPEASLTTKLVATERMGAALARLVGY